MIRARRHHCYEYLSSAGRSTRLAKRSHVGQMTDLPLMIYSRHLREDLYGLAHVAGWEPYHLYDLTNVSRVGYICTLYIRVRQVPEKRVK